MCWCVLISQPRSNLAVLFGSQVAQYVAIATRVVKERGQHPAADSPRSNWLSMKWYEMYGMDTNCRAGGSKNRTVKDPSRNQCLLCLVCLRTLLVRIRVTMATTATRAIATMAIATTVMATKMAMGWKWTASACHGSYSCVVDGWCGIGNCWKAEPCLAGHTLESFLPFFNSLVVTCSFLLLTCNYLCRFKPS